MRTTSGNWRLLFWILLLRLLSNSALMTLKIITLHVYAAPVLFSMSKQTKSNGRQRASSIPLANRNRSLNWHSRISTGICVSSAETFTRSCSGISAGNCVSSVEPSQQTVVHLRLLRHALMDCKIMHQINRILGDGNRDSSTTSNYVTSGQMQQLMTTLVC